MIEAQYPFGFEAIWADMGEDGWTCEPLPDSLVRIVAEGVEMTYADAPTYDSEVFGLAAIICPVDGLQDAGRLCEEALEWNATHDVTLSLVGDEPLLRAFFAEEARRFDAAHFRAAIRQVADAVTVWRERTNVEGGAR